MKVLSTVFLMALAASSICQTPGPAAGPATKTTRTTAAGAQARPKLTAAARLKIRDEVLLELKTPADKVMKIKDLDKELRDKVKAMHKTAKGLTPEDKKAQAKELNEWRVGKMKEILGEDGFKQFNKLMHQKMKEALKAAVADRKP